MASGPPDSEDCPIVLRLFGTAHLLDSDGREAREVLRQPKRFALLIYLALEGSRGYVRRDALLAMFWPKHDRSRALGSLRQALRFLRKHLGLQVITRRGFVDVGLAPDRWICDVQSFDGLYDGGQYAEAMAQYRGDLLEGFCVEGVPGFDDWLEDRRIPLRQRATKAALSLALQAEERGDAGAVAFWANRAVSFVPYEEGTVRTVMGLLDRVGDRAGALGAYRRLERWLGDEFEAVPSPKTRELLASIHERTTPLAEQANDAGPSLWFPARSGSSRRSDPDRRHGERRVSARDRRTGEDRRGLAEESTRARAMIEAT